MPVKAEQGYVPSYTLLSLMIPINVARHFDCGRTRRDPHLAKQSFSAEIQIYPLRIKGNTLMDPNNIRHVKRRPYRSFIALLYSLLGWGLFETWLFLIGAGFSLHIFVAIPAATLTIRSGLLPSIDRSTLAERKKGWATELRRAKMACVALYVLGATFGTMVLGESLTLLGAIAVLFTFFPWGRSLFIRNNLSISCVSTIGGFVSIVAIEHRSIEIMFLPLAACAFWLCACCALILRVEQMHRAKQETNLITKALETNPRAITAQGYDHV